MLTKRQRGYNIAVEKRAEHGPPLDTMRSTMNEMIGMVNDLGNGMSEDRREIFKGAVEANNDMLRAGL